MEFPPQVVSTKYDMCTMNVRNEPVPDMAFVVKREIPPRMEVETLLVSISKKHLSFGNKFDCVEGFRLYVFLKAK